jgi:hypothetical protein
MTHAPMPNPPPKPDPPKGLLHWLGRQVGYVAKAIKTNVTAKTIYRDSRTEEKSLPHDPNVKLRRTVIDEVVVNTPPQNNPPRKPG